jgi:hypothetical protein
MTNFDRTAAWLHACGKGKTVPNLSVQVGCHMEEFIELFDCFELSSDMVNRILGNALAELTYVARKLKDGSEVAHLIREKREDALDSLCDQEVTGNGIAYLADFDKATADQRVLDSNDAKLVDGQPVILAGGKIGKPEGWVAPNLSDCV